MDKGVVESDILAILEQDIAK